MLIAITGSSGYIGTALNAALTAEGHAVLPVRRGPSADPGALWDPASGWMRPDAFDGVDAVVHLGGVSIAAERWTKSRKAALRASRVDSTALLSSHLAALPDPPRTLVMASGAGYYGDAGEEVVTEADAQGDGFLAGLVADWEAAATPAQAAGVRVVYARFGPLIGPRGELLQRRRLPFRLGVGGPIGHAVSGSRGSLPRMRFARSGLRCAVRTPAARLTLSRQRRCVTATSRPHLAGNCIVPR